MIEGIQLLVDVIANNKCLFPSGWSSVPSAAEQPDEQAGEQHELQPEQGLHAQSADAAQQRLEQSEPQQPRHAQPAGAGHQSAGPESLQPGTEHE